MMFMTAPQLANYREQTHKKQVSATGSKMCYGWYCSLGRKGQRHSIKQFELSDGSIAETCKQCRGGK